jgi:hypothetical protein
VRQVGNHLDRLDHGVIVAAVLIVVCERMGTGRRPTNRV